VIVVQQSGAGRNETWGLEDDAPTVDGKRGIAFRRSDKPCHIIKPVKVAVSHTYWH